MKTIFILFFILLLYSCGANRGKIEVIQTGPDEFLVIDNNCTAVVRRRQASRGARKNYYINDSEGFCHVTNITLGEHMSDAYGIEGVFEDGERVYIWSEENMERLLKYLIRNGMANRER